MRLLGIIGYPLGHSFSQGYFTEKFRNENLPDYVYRKFEIPSIEYLLPLLDTEKDLCGFNVTIPYKVQVMKYLDEIDEAASEIGAVNTVKVSRAGGRVSLKGFNTDAPAFRMSLLENLVEIPETALVLGTGGASKSVRHILTELGIRPLPVSRTSAPGVFSYKTIPKDEITAAGLIVNTTPVGTFPDINACPPLDYSCLRQGQLLFDLIYNPPLTQFLKHGEDHECYIVNGEQMFRYQAEMAWKIWTDTSK